MSGEKHFYPEHKLASSSKAMWDVNIYDTASGLLNIKSK